MVRALVMGAALLVAAGCSGDAPDDPSNDPPTTTGSFPPSPNTLAFVDDLNIPTGTMLAGVEVGGLSGLWIEPTTGEGWAISDDRNGYGPPRFYRLAVGLDDALTIDLLEPVPIATGSAAANETDAEGIVRLEDGSLVVSTEGDSAIPLGPTLLHLDAGGGLIAELPVAAKLQPDAAPQSQGVRRNMGLEALARSVDGRTLWTATEGPMVPDGPLPTFAEGGRCRLMRHDLDAGGGPVAEFVYLTDPIPPAAAGTLGAQGIGLVELAVLPDGRLWSLERAAVQVDGVYTNTIRVFEIDVSAATDVSAVAALDGSAVPVAKSLVFDLDAILPSLDPAFPRLDNVEAMSLGPPLPDGRPSLVLMSDNNFGADQRTAFFAFAIE